MSVWQDIRLDANRANLLKPSAVGANALVYDLLADDFFLKFSQDIRDDLLLPALFLSYFVGQNLLSDLG